MAKCVPWLLVPEQKEHCAAVANDLIQTINSEPDFLKEVITGAKSRIYSYDLEAKAQSSQWKLPGSPHLKKTQQSHRKIKTVLTVFFDWKGLSLMLSPPGQTINKRYYSMFFVGWEINVMRMAAVMGNWWLAASSPQCAHASHLMQSFLVKHQITQVTQPPYSPDLVLCDFWHFQKLKSPLKGKRFQTVDKIQVNLMGQLIVIPTMDFAECFEKWKRLWENCVRSQGAYYERTKASLFHVQCFLYLVSSSRNVSIFHST